MALSTKDDVDQWKEHFLAMVDGKLNSSSDYTANTSQRGMGLSRNSLFRVGNQHGSGEQANLIKFVSPMAQTVEQAKATVKRGIKRKNPNTRVSRGVKKPRGSKSVRPKTQKKKTPKQKKLVRKRKTKRKPQKTAQKKTDIFS